MAMAINQGQAEILVFGFQELVELDNTSVTAKSMFHSKRKKEKEGAVVTSSHISHQYKAWQDKLDEFVGSNLSERYRLVHSNNMVGLFTCVFMKESECNRVRDIKSSAIKTGLGGLHGNKGGLAVRMVVDDSSLCFVNCHLAAGQSGVLQRNSDIETILETKFSDASDNTNFTSKGIFVNGGDGTKIMDHEICFFFGDMNYRINRHRQVAIKAIEENAFDQLLEYDQLGLQLKKNPGLRLRAFSEKPITFAPTYKFDVGSDRYDSSDKKRVPAWCDRIFYRGGLKVVPASYYSFSVRASDHRPVTGVYSVQLKTIDPGKRKEVYKDSLLRWKEYLAV
ncbi:phosphatidylinositol-3-/phosphoinositide 5-phosphatase INP53 [Sugiyamaella lignohabitans]|uniref:Phosphatidylinositol-3-/phosphoinositide 5-phosphatase INP53 n=1 Tax=Sugiyamaella lignohabitans TaxID=796027 RepID=A0A167CMI5_9ASCO|nr:phosphatidylinositol-3-/phosphoinositide 5-phosphatase INP53 [Sugiyamaella lignohabitans]ANB11889.1 phosphatidylinositol-3-/phosphoinositide 5-phosphatase INP53 [Sugiyamaella lignohabitans]